jgi:hypothetical protein
VGSNENATLVRGEHGNFSCRAECPSADLLFTIITPLLKNRRLTRLRLPSSQNHDAGSNQSDPSQLGDRTALLQKSTPKVIAVIASNPSSSPDARAS